MPQIDTIQIVPDSWNPGAQVLQHADIVPTYSLPSDKIFMQYKGHEWTHQQLFARGVTQLAHGDLEGISEPDRQALRDAGKTLDNVRITPELFGIGATGPFGWVGDYAAGTLYNTLYFPNGLPTYEQGYQYGQNTDISHKIGVGETMENNHYTSPNHAFWKGFYDAAMPRRDAKWGVGNWRWAHDYGFVNFAPAWDYISESEAKAKFRSPTGGIPNLDKCNMYTHLIYPGGPDYDKRYVYNIALSARYYKLLGKHSVGYATNMHEWHPNNFNGITGSEGVLYKQDKYPQNLSFAAGTLVACMHYGDGFVPWLTGSKVTVKVMSGYWTEQFSNGSFWVKNGETAQRDWRTWTGFEINPSDSNYNFVNWLAGVEDVWSFAAYAYAATLGQVYGGTAKTPTYRVNGGAWVTPINTLSDDLIKAKYSSLPVVETVVRDGKEAILFIDPTSNNRKKTIDIQGQTGTTYTFEACGDMPYMSLQTL